MPCCGLVWREKGKVHLMVQHAAPLLPVCLDNQTLTVDHLGWACARVCDVQQQQAAREEW